MRQMMGERDDLKTELREIKIENKQFKKKIQMMEQRERYNDALRRNWNNQLAQMEQAVLLANQIHNRDRVQYQRELDDHTQENIRLKKFLKVLTKRQRTNHGNVVRPVRTGGSRKTARRNRGKRQSIDFRIHRKETPGGNWGTPGGTDEPRSRYSPRERSPRRERTPPYSHREKRDSSYSPKRDTRSFLE